MDRWRLMLLAVVVLSMGFWFPWRSSVKPEQKVDVPTAPRQVGPAAIDFDAQVKPILAAKCQPCHFPGGKMHALLPFDDPLTIRKLGTQLFTRIRDEKDRARIRAFLAQTSAKS